MTRRELLRRSFAAIAIGVGSGPSSLADHKSWPRLILEWGKRGKDEGEFDIPIGIAINRKDEIFVTEFRNNRVQKFTTGGKLLSVMPVLDGPGGIAVDNKGRLYIAHLMLHKITAYESDGKPAFEFGKHGVGDGELDQPGGMAIAQDGSIYVADQVNRCVQRFTRDGKFMLKWGEYGVGPGQFGGNSPKPGRVGGPNFVAVDRRGFVYTTEASVGRVQKFTPDGKYILSWGDNGEQPGGFGGRKKNLPGPIAIVVDRRGYLWISATNNRVQQFTDQGRYLRGFGVEGAQPGQFQTPHGMVFDSKGHLYVCDTQNARVQKFAV
jgi:tripartite motif-containing protein 71